MSRIRARAVLLSLFGSFVLMSGCFGGIGVDSEPGPGYVVEVRNPQPEPMVVSYDDGTGVRLLGLVAAEATGRFVITKPAKLDVTIVASDEEQTQSITRDVQLSEGTPREVVLVP